ncbi:hypothetical protein BV25DRAFT_1736218 [Artomyces pyxidatus]|uniref:Uncharacterized protein n=1 Tax=Artomyces pyxidatus TaxID=48021 RepID=A0ACB8SGU1_9AGAM|nr:hypothetical protein BV25DRAFT_1736218 [Artomyces pyxidatus]
MSRSDGPAIFSRYNMRFSRKHRTREAQTQSPTTDNHAVQDHSARLLAAHRGLPRCPPRSARPICIFVVRRFPCPHPSPCSVSIHAQSAQSHRRLSWVPARPTPSRMYRTTHIGLGCLCSAAQCALHSARLAVSSRTALSCRALCVLHLTYCVFALHTGSYVDFEGSQSSCAASTNLGDPWEQ